jgi:riboflavin kinase/FMN adenylyltransferase
MKMKVVEGLENLPGSVRGCVLTIGNFDGVHRGHQRIIEVARRKAAAEKTSLVVMTFDPTPAVLLVPERAPQLILPNEVKYRLLGECGATLVAVVHTTPEFLALSPEDFLRLILEKFAPRHLVEGPNFFYGKGRCGNVETLKAQAPAMNFGVSIVEAVKLEIAEEGGEVRVSSSIVRRLIREGHVADAARCLRRPFTLYGLVVGGEHRGRLLEFPTANVDPNGLVSPDDGVYAGSVEIGAATYLAAISVGAKPTFGGEARAIEAHLLDASGDFYDQPIALTFVQRLRDQRKFPDVESLKAQIAKDVQRVRELLT